MRDTVNNFNWFIWDAIYIQYMQSVNVRIRFLGEIQN